MGIETRGNGEYYYKKRRCGHKVVSEYCGGGEIGAICYLLDKEERNEKEREQTERRQDELRDSALFNGLNDYCKSVDLLL